MKYIFYFLALCVLAGMQLGANAQNYIKVSLQSLDFGNAKVGSYGTPLKVNISVIDPDDSEEVASATLEGSPSAFMTYTKQFYPSKEEGDPMPVTFYFKPTEAKEYADKYIIKYKDETVVIDLKGNGIDPENPYNLSESDPITSSSSNFNDIKYGDWKIVKVAGSQTWQDSPWGVATPYASFSAQSDEASENEQSRAKLVYIKAIDCDHLNIRKAILSIKAINPKDRSGLRVYLADKKDDPSSAFDLFHYTGAQASEMANDFVEKEMNIPESVSGIKFLIFEAWGENNDQGNTEWQITNLRLGLKKLNPLLEVKKAEFFCGSAKVNQSDISTQSIKIFAKDMPEGQNKIDIKFLGGIESAFSSSQTALYPYSEEIPTYLNVHFRPKAIGYNTDSLILTFNNQQTKIKLSGIGLDTEDPYSLNNTNAVDELELFPRIQKDMWTTVSFNGETLFTEEENDGENYLKYDIIDSDNENDSAILVSPLISQNKLVNGEIELNLRIKKHKEEELIPRLKLSIANKKDDQAAEKTLFLTTEYQSEVDPTHLDANQFVSNSFITKKIILTKEMLATLKSDILLKIAIDGSCRFGKTATWQIGKCKITKKAIDSNEIMTKGYHLAIQNQYIRIATSINTPIEIFMIDGKLIYKKFVTGEITIPVAKGTYIMKIGNEVTKFNVK